MKYPIAGPPVADTERRRTTIQREQRSQLEKKTVKSETGPSEAPRGGELPWWHNLVNSAILGPVIDPNRTVFTNRTLRFDRINAVGFDLDHTLAIYNCSALDSLAMRRSLIYLRRTESRTSP